jgi:hypothetical protein
VLICVLPMRTRDVLNTSTHHGSSLEARISTHGKGYYHVLMPVTM